MSCGCSSVHTPPTITSCNATYNVCTGKSFYINVIGCTDPIVTIPTQSEIGYPIVGLLEYSESNKKIYYTHNGSNSGVATTDSFTYTVVCNGTSKTCTITVNIDDSISVDTTVVELDGCCIPTYTSKVYGSTIYSIIVDNVNILNTSYTSDTALSTFLNTYINVNGTFTVTKTTVSDVVNWTIVLESNTKVLNSVTGLSLVQGIKTLCGCKLGDVEYTWTIPDCATLVTGYSVHDCKIQVIVPLYDALDDACCPIELTVRCGNCTSNCEKTEVYNWCPPIYENCTTPDCSLYPCTTYNPISGNCDNICDECDTCCQNENGYYCAECCDNNGCALANCPEASQPICVGQECVCYVNGIEVEPLPNGCCPNCTELTVLPNCHTCVNGIIVAPDTTCPTNKVYNYDTCQCECDCLNGFCYNVLTQNCEPCPVCTTITGLYTCNGEPYTATLAPCTQCINNEIVPVVCAGNSIPNPYFNPNSPVSVTNPCCISLTPCDCDNPDCVGQGSVCTHIEGSEECYCVDCTSLSCTNTSVICEEVNGCDCVGNNCVSGCPTCTGTVSVKEYCNPFFVKFEGCLNNNYRFKVYELTNLLEKPVLGCSYQSYLDEYNNNNANLTDITSTVWTTTEYNVTSSVFFNPAILGSNNYITIPIPKDDVQTILIKVVKYEIETIYEFVLDGDTCLLASEDNQDTDLIIPTNPRIFRETCKFIYSLKSTGVCPFTDYEWTFPNTTGEDETAQEIQNGKYIVIFPPDFALGTTRQVCASAEYIYNEVVCYVKEACKDYTPCTGGCGCDPCTDPNSSFITSIETITDAVNSTINASASVLLNCNGTLGGMLATCEPAESNENCSPGNGLVIPNNNGTSPLPFSLYPNYDANSTAYTPCGLWECTENVIGCEQDNDAPCGWMYDDAKLEVLSYNGANIEVGFINGAITGKLCWGARYECGYVCNCKEITKILSCEDYGITDVSINCTPTPTPTNVGSIVVTVNNYSDPYKIEVYKQGTPNTLLGTYPPSPATSIVTSPYTITIPESWGITNGDELIIKVIMLVDGLDCDYEESVIYSCCVTPTLSGLTFVCNPNAGQITSITFTTNTAGNPYTIYTNGGLIPIANGTTVSGTNNHTFSSPLNGSTVTSIEVKVCDDNTEDCCANLNVNVTCTKNCTISEETIDVACVNNIIQSINIDATTESAGNFNLLITNTTNSNILNIANIPLPYTSTLTHINTLDISVGDTITAIISVTGEPTCNTTVSVIVADCCDTTITVDDITTCLVTGGGSVTLISSFTPVCTSGSITSVVSNLPNATTLPLGWTYLNNILTYDGTVTAGTYRFEATGTCGNCTSTDTFTVYIDDVTAIATISNDCNSLTNPTSINLNDALTIVGDGIVVFKTGVTITCNSNGLLSTGGTIITTPTDWNTIGTNTVFYQYINTLGCDKCGSFEVVIDDCCTLTLGTPIQNCNSAGELISVTFPFSGAAYPVIISGTTTYDHNGDGTGDFILNPVANGVVTITDNTITEFVVPYPTVPNLESNCITANLTFTDDNGCTDSITTTCTPCSPTVSFKCENGNCYDPGDGTGTHTTENACKNSCPCTTMTLASVTGCLANNTVNIIPAFTAACNDIDNNIAVGNIVSITDDNNPSNSWTITHDPLPSLPQNYTITYPQGIAPGTYNLTANWVCGVCNGNTQFTVTINPNPSVTATSHTDVCPFDLNLLLTVSPTGGTTIFKTGSTCQNGTLSGGTDIMLPTNYNTNIPNQAIQYQYTINGCSVCGEFTVTCCSANAGDDTNQTYCY